MNLLTTTTFIALFAIGVTANSTNAGHISSHISNPQSITIETKQLTQQQVDILVDRIYEIRSMDLKALNRAEKQQLRKELLSIQEQLNHPTGGVYISVGGLILILILLIILF